MSHRTVPVLDAHTETGGPARAPGAAAPDGSVADRLGRRLRDLRISVTDRCNLRCTYCMPKELFGRDHPFLPHRELLRFEEITRLARLFVAHGVEKIRLTGGEPLLRKDVERLVAMLARLETRDGRPLDLTLTTNGVLLARKIPALAAAGLRRITVSLDALDDATARRIGDAPVRVADVLAGIEAAAAAGLAPIKVNMVVQRGVNEDQILPMALRFHGTGHVLRFIEYMDVGNTNGWERGEVVPSAEVLRRIHAELPLEPVDAAYPGEVAARWRYRDGGGEIGVISSVTRAFCRDCTRARLSTEGRLYLCLFASRGHDLRALLRGGATDDELGAAIGAIWRGRDDRYSELRALLDDEARAKRPKIEMSYIGG